MSDLWSGTRGPKDAPIMLVGEAWGQEELSAQMPFVGNSGNELNRMLAEAGIDHRDVLMTNILRDKPYKNQMWRFFEGSQTVKGLRPNQQILDNLKRLDDQIAAHPRKLIIGAGNYPLWALTDCANTTSVTDFEAKGKKLKQPAGIMNWRGSMWYCSGEHSSTKYLPIIHPAAIVRQWALRSVTVHDLKARIPLALADDWRPSQQPIVWAPPTFEQATSRLRYWLGLANSGTVIRLATDIETIPSRRLLVCIGFADSLNFAMSIPFLKPMADGTTADYWTSEQEVDLVDLLRRVLSHPNIKIEGQNFNYDNQYIQYTWAITPLIDFDTMAAQHLLWPGTPKGLDYISSLYCHYHWYWKEDGKDWDVRMDLPSQLRYNAEDCLRTYEAATQMRAVIKQLGLERQWNETRERHWLALRMMNKGVLIDTKRKADIGLQLSEVASRLSRELEEIIPDCMLPEKKKGAKDTKWYNSPLKQKYVFGELLGIKLPKDRKTGNETLNKAALLDLGRKYPHWIGLFKRLGSLRSVEVFQSHFVGMRLNVRNRAGCFFKIDGTETFRWSSAKNAFNEGANLQTIPAGDED